jgi:hypothetical protein
MRIVCLMVKFAHHELYLFETITPTPLLKVAGMKQGAELASAIGGGDIVPFRPGMTGRDDEDELIARDSVRDNRRILDRAFNKTEFSGAVVACARHTVDVADCHPQLDQRIASAIGHKARPEPVAGDRLACNRYLARRALRNPA